MPRWPASAFSRASRSPSHPPRQRLPPHGENLSRYARRTPLLQICLKDPYGLPVLTSQSALRLSITTSRWSHPARDPEGSFPPLGRPHLSSTLNDHLVGAVRETMLPTHVSLWLCPETAPKGEQADWKILIRPTRGGGVIKSSHCTWVHGRATRV
jgi:hypothetical protein